MGLVILDCHFLIQALSNVSNVSIRGSTYHAANALAKEACSMSGPNCLENALPSHLSYVLMAVE